ncbi:hypothetical protein AMATHDRAFT_962 [Amanita thiersii Skay4041]|uniref:Carboxymuconolactone decarboxylase-like domain-containing protein n=1 Tax=Amanita thiersii Skay4041 TaxID=703135 RepID=A0A2A9NYU6_9AGAR|nr:hypothetical protein AMATHDRAFT_962 [Amanita thiersii Skay4041]
MSAERPNEGAHQELYDAGITMRRKGNEYVDNQLKKASLPHSVSPSSQPLTKTLTGRIAVYEANAAARDRGQVWVTQVTQRVQAAWGTIWTRPGLELKQRSLIVIAILASQGKQAETALIDAYLMIRGAVNNGATEVEIIETLLQAATYCGIPTGMESFRVAEAVIAQLKDEGKLPK